MSSLDLLVFGPHPDDIEIGLGATVAHHAASGLSVGLCDLTAGEMGTNGTVEERLEEDEAARQVLGAVWRKNLRWPDGRIGRSENHLADAVSFIRKHRPRAIAIPYWEDRHPDHVAASTILTEAIFKSGLRQFKSEAEAWRPEWTCYYFINDAAEPSFVVDVSAHYDTKRRALDCHASQFRRDNPKAAATRLNAPTFRQLIESRDAQFGARAGVAWAEGVVVKQPVVRETLLKDGR